MNAKHYENCTISLLMTLMLLLTSPAFSQGLKIYPKVIVSGEEIPVIESDRNLITGIDVDKVLSRYIEDYQAFESTFAIGSAGLARYWSVKPDPNDLETRYFWGKKRDDPYYRRYIGADIGVHSSHKEALEAASRYFSNIQGIPVLDLLKDDDPGFVSWSDGNIFIRDNVFVTLRLSESLNPEKVIQQLDQDFKYGAEGITKGKQLETPVFSDAEFPDRLTWQKDQKVTISLKVTDPNERRVYRDIFVSGSDRKVDGVHNTPMITSTWSKDHQLFFEFKEPLDHDVEFTAYAYNDLCVAAPVWTKTVHIVVTE